MSVKNVFCLGLILLVTLVSRLPGQKIHQAVKEGKLEVVKKMLEEDRDLINAVDSDLKTPLHLATEHGYMPMVELLLEEGADINAKTGFKRTPLHFAASRGHDAVINLLLEKGADINLKSLDGRTPLHTAVDCKQLEAVELIKARGADSRPREFTVPEGRYFGQKPPGLKPEIFAPAIISTDGYEFAITFSPDGKELYFTRREGEKNYPTNYLMVCRYENNRWTEPEIASFSGKYFDFESHISPDGQKLYFGSLRPKPLEIQAEGSIWFLEKTDHGWGEPGFLDAPINDGFAMYVTSAKNGNLYYTGADGQYCSVNKDGKYGEPEKLKDESDEYFSGAHTFIAPDESYLIFDSDPGLVISFRKEDGTWTKIKEMGIIPNMCPSVSPDGKYLFFTRHGNIYWVDAKIIEDLKPKALK